VQLQLDLDSRLTERYPTLTDVCRAAVARSRRPQKAIAADMDLSPSDLSRKLSDSPTDTRRLLAEDVVPLARACGDSGRDIAIWIAETLLCDERSKQERGFEIEIQNVYTSTSRESVEARERALIEREHEAGNDWLANQEARFPSFRDRLARLAESKLTQSAPVYDDAEPARRLSISVVPVTTRGSVARHAQAVPDPT